jgi:hypothetical protein
MDAAIAKIILSQTMTTDNGSSRSQAEVHQDVADSVIESDADLICESFNNSVVKWLTDWNFPGAAYPKVWRKLESDPDVGILADTDTKLQGLGISLKPEAIATRYGDDYLIPERDDSPQLSGEQTNALINIVSSAKAGGWSPELVTGLINSALPVLTETAVAAITSNLGDAIGGDVPDPNLDEVEDESESEDDDAEFAQILQFPGVKKKKTCTKGLSCGGACISPLKTCRKELSQKQNDNLLIIQTGLKLLPKQNPLKLVEPPKPSGMVVTRTSVNVEKAIRDADEALREAARAKKDLEKTSRSLERIKKRTEDDYPTL